MIELKVKVTFDEEILGTASSNMEAHDTYVASNAPEEADRKEEVEALESEEENRPMTVFPRGEDGKPFVWDYQWKGFFKDACGVLRKLSKNECAKIKAYKKEIDGLVFIDERRIPVEFDGDITICTRPLRAQTMQGERIALASSEAIPTGATMVFTILLFQDSHEKAILEMLDYGRFRGFGQWRNSGKGRFHYEILDRKAE